LRVGEDVANDLRGGSAEEDAWEGPKDVL